jgi:hypothetical protein
MTELRSPLQAHIVQSLVQPGQAVHTGQLLLVLEAMKMEHEICAPADGTKALCCWYWTRTRPMRPWRQTGRRQAQLWRLRPLKSQARRRPPRPLQIPICARI